MMTPRRFSSVLLICSLCINLFISSLQAVELTPEQYQQAVADIQLIYGSGAQAELTFLRAENTDGMVHYFPPGETQGYFTIKAPVKKDQITLLQIPHAFFDLHSLDIGQQMFDTQWVDVIMVNTQHRYETERSDLARLRYSLFTAVVEGLLKLNKDVKIIQVHGFNEARRKTLSGENADAILSNGSPVADTYMLLVQSCLRDNADLVGRVYGRDVFELGATVNPVGKLLRASAPHNMHFLHIELPRRIRDIMVSGDDNTEVLRCLLDH